MSIRKLSDAEPFQCAGIDFGMLLPRHVTDSVEIVLEILKPGMKTPSDQHATFDQVFWILEGEGEITNWRGKGADWRTELRVHPTMHTSLDSMRIRWRSEIFVSERMGQGCTGTRKTLVVHRLTDPCPTHRGARSRRGREFQLMNLGFCPSALEPLANLLSGAI